MEWVDAFKDVNYWVVLVAVLSTFAVGMAWYSETMFGKIWMKELGLKKKDLEDKDGMVFYKDLFQTMAGYFGNKPPTKTIGKGTLLFFCYLDALFSFLFRSKRKLLRSMVDSMYSTPQYDASKIKLELGFQFTPSAETLERVVKNYSSLSSTGSDN